MSAVELLDQWIEEAATGEEDRRARMAWHTIRGQIAAYEKRIATLQGQLAAAQRVVLRLGGEAT